MTGTFCRRTLTSLLALAVLVSFSVGCSSLATQKKMYEPITQSVKAQNFSAAAQKMEKLHEDGKFANKDRLLYYVDAGSLNHFAGNYELSNERLHAADQAADELYTKSISRAVTSMLLNDNVLEYAGEDYELLYINIIKALNFIALDDFEGAFVEIRRLNEKLDLLENKYVEMAREFRVAAAKDTTVPDIDYQAEKVRFFNNAFARYLSMHMYAAAGQLDDARIDYDLLLDAFATQSHIYDFEPPPITYRRDSAALVSFVALVGLGPEKKAVNLRLRTDKQLNLVQIMYDDGEQKGQQYTHLPLKVNADYYFKFAIPKLVRRDTTIERIDVLANGEAVGSLHLIEDVSAIAKEIFDVKKTVILLRSVGRALAKGLATHELKEELDSGGLGGWLAKAAVDVGQDVLENADLRNAQYLPGRVYVGDFHLEPGTYDFTVEFFDRDNHLVGRNFIEGYSVKKKGLNLVEALALY